MKKLLITLGAISIILLISFLISLNAIGKIKSENNSLLNKHSDLRNKTMEQQRKIDELNSIVETLKKTDNYYYQMAISNREEKKYEESNKYLNEMIDRFPKSRYFAQARTLIRRNNNDVQRHKIAQEKERKEREEANLRRDCDLELITWSWSKTESGNYVEAKGQVKNISDKSLRSVCALVTFKDKNGSFITADESLIDLNPILPGQTSSFTVMETSNPAMQKASIQFKYFAGGTIQTYRKK